MLSGMLRALDVLGRRNNMKRSDMVKEMTRHWLALFPGEKAELLYGSEIVKSIEDNMSSLLWFLEHKGMQPPVEEVCPVLFTNKRVWEKEDGPPDNI